MRRQMTNSGTESCPILFTCAQPDYSARLFLDTPGIRPLTVRAELLAMSKPSMTMRCITADDTTLTSVKYHSQLQTLFVPFHGLRRRSAKAGLTVNTGVITGGDYTDIGLRDDLWAVLAGPLRPPRGAIHRVSAACSSESISRKLMR